MIFWFRAIWLRSKRLPFGWMRIGNDLEMSGVLWSTSFWIAKERSLLLLAKVHICEWNWAFWSTILQGERKTSQIGYPSSLPLLAAIESRSTWYQLSWEDSALTASFTLFKDSEGYACSDAKECWELLDCVDCSIKNLKEDSRLLKIDGPYFSSKQQVET